MNRRHYKLETGCNSNARTAKTAKTPKTPKTPNQVEIGENGEIMLRQNPHGVRILIQVDIEITTNQDDVKSARCADFQSA